MEEFKTTVEVFWMNTEIIFPSTSALFRFSKKLKLLKPALRSLSRQKLHHLSRRVEEAYAALCTCQNSTLLQPTPTAVQTEALAFDRWEKISMMEEKFLKQKSKLHSMEVGDKNNIFFHNAVKEKHARSSIREIMNPQGETLTCGDDIKN